MAKGLGEKTWLIPDGFLPIHSTGDFPSHEAICVLNTGDADAHLNICFYFEDRDPMTDFEFVCGSNRTQHIRLDRLKDKNGNGVPTGVPYAIKVCSDVEIVVQHSRMDTTQPAMTLMTTMAHPIK